MMEDGSQTNEEANNQSETTQPELEILYKEVLAAS